MIKKLCSVVIGLFVLSACQGKSGHDSAWMNGRLTNTELAKGVPDTVFFEFNSSSLTDSEKEILNLHADFWKNNGEPSLVVEGHCDERGTREYNLALGERRANAVKKYLVSKGVAASKIDTISYGKERPLAIGEGQEVWSKNRRAVTVKPN